MRSWAFGFTGGEAGLPGRMRLDPSFVVLLHLFDVVRDVALLQLDPVLESESRFLRILNRMRPDRLGNGNEKLVGHLAQAPNDFERFARALVEVARASRPSARDRFGTPSCRARR